MCGIVGIYSKDGSLTPGEYAAFRAGWLKAQSRGTDAAGWAMWDSTDGGSIWFWKSPGPSSLGVRSLPDYRPGIGWIIGHTRYATSGSPLKNINNHPIVTGPDKDLLGIHNGVIWNKDEILKDHKWDARREVDTEIAFRLLCHYGPKHQGAALRELKGSHCLAWARHSDGARLWLSRWDNPLHLWNTKSFRAFGSSADYFDGPTMGELPEGVMVSWNGRQTPKRLRWRKERPAVSMAEWDHHWLRSYYQQERHVPTIRQGAYIDPDTGVLEGLTWPIRPEDGEPGAGGGA